MLLFKYAQKIVDTISGIIGYDVLITDREGIIIACSNPLRGKGTFHEGTLRAVQNNQWYIDVPEDVQNLKGTGEGITCPISDPTGGVVGVIAVSGDPQKVKAFGLVVQHFADLMLRERMLLESAHEEERNRLDLLRKMIYFDPKMDNGAEIYQWASRFGFSNLKNYKVMVLRNAHSDHGGDSASIYVEKCMKTISSCSIVLKGQIDDEGLAIIYEEANSIIDRLDCQSSVFEKKLKQFSAGKSFKLGIGAAGKGLSGISKSFSEAIKSLKMAELLGYRESFADIEDLRVEEMLLSVGRELARSLVSKQLDQLKVLPDYPALRKTLMAWFENDLSVMKTSEALHLHRNSLHYRIQKMEELLGISLKSFSQVHSLYLALVLESLLELR